MNRRKRNPLDKPRFLGSIRQIWLLIIFICGGGILWADLKNDIKADDYLEFILVSGTVFIIGSSVDSALKITKVNKKPGDEE